MGELRKALEATRTRNDHTRLLEETLVWTAGEANEELAVKILRK